MYKVRLRFPCFNSYRRQGSSIIFILLTLFLNFPNAAFSELITVPGDYATIQQAIDTAAAGDEIVVPPGTYKKSVTGISETAFPTKTIYVDDDNPTTGTGTIEDPYNKIQTAIDNAVDGDEVIVNPGRYVENLSISNKSITISSNSYRNWDTINNTVVDGNRTDSVIKIVNSGTNYSRIRGLTIIQGQGKTSYRTSRGGGLYCNNGKLILDHCVFNNNRATGSNPGGHGLGGGLFCEDAELHIIDCIFSNNIVRGGKCYYW